MNIAAVLAIHRYLLPGLERMHAILAKQARDFNDIIKIGRTHTQDATPLTLGTAPVALLSSHRAL